jgi:hypothetical protein
MTRQVFLLVLFGGGGTCAAARDAPAVVLGAREAQLDALKKAFPAHTAGAVTDASDPLIRDCYFEFARGVERLAVDSLARGVGELRQLVERRIAKYRSLYERARRKQLELQTPSLRRAIEQNFTWLTQKVRPYIARLETFQRGREP